MQQMSCTCSLILMPSVKWNPRYFSVVENDMTLCPNEREVQFKFGVYLFGRIRRHSVFLLFNCSLFSIIHFLYIRNSAMNMLGKNRRFDLNVISQQVDTQRMLFD